MSTEEPRPAEDPDGMGGAGDGPTPGWPPSPGPHPGPHQGWPAQTGGQHAWPPPGPHPGWSPAPAALAPQHPRSTAALVLGVLALAGGLACGVPLVLAPVAWVVGGRAVREIDAAPGHWRGRDLAEAGRIMGIVGTALLAAGAFLVLLVLVVTTAPLFLGF